MTTPPAPDALVQLSGRRLLREDEFVRLIEELEKRRVAVATDDEPFDLYAETVCDSRFRHPQAAAPDCRACGACCLFFQQIPVQLTDATPRSLTWEVRDSDDVDEPPLSWLRRDPLTAACVAFRGSLGASAECRIYDLRPRACQAFEAGSDRCHALRRRCGLEPQLSAAEIETRRRALQQQAEATDDDDAPARVPANASDTAAPATSSQTAAAEDTARQLRELVSYNLDKLLDIHSEIERLVKLPEGKLTLVAENPALALRQEGKDALRHINDNRLAILDTFADLDRASLDAARRFHQLLQIAAFSQDSLEDAAARLAHLSEQAYEALIAGARF